VDTMNATPTALSGLEERIWEHYAQRLGELRCDPRAAEVLSYYHLEEIANGSLDGARMSDLAVAIHHLENAFDDRRAALPEIALMEPDDIARHPGFDGVESEVVAEEDHLLAIRKAIRSE